MRRFFNSVSTEVINTINQKKDVTFYVFAYHMEHHYDKFVCELTGRDIPDLNKKYGLNFVTDNFYGHVSTLEQKDIKAFIQANQVEDINLGAYSVIVLRVCAAPEEKQKHVIEMQPF
jgi:hypothetical protein